MVGYGPKSKCVRNQFDGALFRLLEWQGKDFFYVFPRLLASGGTRLEI